MKLDQAVDRACEEPTLAEALSWAAVWETERVVAQVREYDRTKASTASHGGSHDTCFLMIFKRVLAKWELLRSVEDGRA